jgi:hypothetical protein
MGWLRVWAKASTLVRVVMVASVLVVGAAGVVSAPAAHAEDVWCVIC